MHVFIHLHLLLFQKGPKETYKDTNNIRKTKSEKEEGIRVKGIKGRKARGSCLAAHRTVRPPHSCMRLATKLPALSSSGVR